MKKNTGEASTLSRQGKGLRKSVARDAILDTFMNAGKPLSVPGIITSLSAKGTSVNKTTVYREIETLKKIGRVREVFFRNDTALYEFAGDHHHHLVCVSCGDVREVRLNESLEQEENRLARRERFTILDHSLEFFGMCERCR
ncbi:MAG: transcriptional repressor [Candidatus Moraniibacteriota bacterium]|nr:MAG: transcriptional repressor [Candidatus Moranbacteria bacterium]